MNRAGHFRIVLASSVSMPSLAISQSYNEEEMQEKIRQARVKSAISAHFGEDYAIHSLSPEPLDG